MESPSNPHKRQKRGFESYSNSKVLSDITIRYGVSGERTFEAHKVVISAMSYWFKAAFTGQFAESSAREITLKEDDPDALLLMLNFAYDQKIPSLDDVDNVVRTARSIRDCLGLYRVGDKYDFPQFRDRVISVFKCSIGWWSMQVRSGGPVPINAVVHREFCGFVRDVYDIAGSEHHPSHPLVDVLLGFADDQRSTYMVNDIGHQPLIASACREVAEFGRDIFLHLMAKTGVFHQDGGIVTEALCIAASRRCSECEEVVLMAELKENDWSGHCPRCGDYQLDWRPEMRTYEEDKFIGEGTQSK